MELGQTYGVCPSSCTSGIEICLMPVFEIYMNFCLIIYIVTGMILHENTCKWIPFRVRKIQQHFL